MSTDTADIKEVVKGKVRRSCATRHSPAEVRAAGRLPRTAAVIPSPAIFTMPTRWSDSRRSRAGLARLRQSNRSGAVEVRAKRCSILVRAAVSTCCSPRDVSVHR